MEFFISFGYIGLFVAAFLAATVLPFSSEIVLSALLLNGLPALQVIGVATIGNVLGSVVNYALGYWASFEIIKRFLRISEHDYTKAQQRFHKYGLWSLCLAWVPIIGDPITLIAGVFRVRFIWFLAVVTIGKLLRYLGVSYFILN